MWPTRLRPPRSVPIHLDRMIPNFPQPSIGSAPVGWIRDTNETPERRPTDVAMLVDRHDRRRARGHVGTDPVRARPQPLPHAQQPGREHGRVGPGVLRAGIDLGRARRLASSLLVLRVSPGGVARRARGCRRVGDRRAAERSPGSALDQRARRQRAHRRRAHLPGRERRCHHRAVVRTGPLHRAGVPADLGRDHRARRAGHDVPGRRLSVRRDRRRSCSASRSRRWCAWSSALPAGARRSPKSATRSPISDTSSSTSRPAEEKVPRGVGDGRRARLRRTPPGRRLRSRPARRPHRGQGVALADVPRPGRPGVRESGPAGRAHRVHA